MNRLLIFAAVAESVTGLAMMMAPSLVAQLMLGAELSGVALVVARIGGIGLFSLGLACWPAKDATPSTLSAILTYNLLVVLYLSYLGTRTEWTGSLLWPAVIFHAALMVLLVRAWLAARKATDGGFLGGSR